MARPDKAAGVAELVESFQDSAGAVLTEYRGLTVKQLQDLRRSLGDNASYAVVKNTLTQIAATQAGIEGFDSLLTGPTAIAFISGDPVETAKSLRDFARANSPLVIKGGVLDGKPLTIVAVLTGSLIVLADLIREIQIPLRVALIQASSYKGATTTAGALIINESFAPDVQHLGVRLRQMLDKVLVHHVGAHVTLHRGVGLVHEQVRQLRTRPRIFAHATKLSRPQRLGSVRDVIILGGPNPRVVGFEVSGGAVGDGLVPLGAQTAVSASSLIVPDDFERRIRSEGIRCSKRHSLLVSPHATGATERR